MGDGRWAMRVMVEPESASRTAQTASPPGPLVREARRGDRAAFARLHERYAPVVHGVLLARVPAQDADDLVQEVFMQALRTLGSLRDPNAVGPWLITIARNFAAQFHRRRQPTGELPADLPDTAAIQPLDGTAAAEALEALAAIRTLPVAYRETLLLRLVEGLTGPQIAARTGLTPGSVRVNLYRGLALLRARLGLSDRPEEAS